jgi:hypothetical protein
MAVEFTPKTLAFIQLANSKGDITAVPGAGKKHQVHNIVLHNANSIQEQVQLFYHDGTNEYEISYPLIEPRNTLIIPYGNEGLVIEAAGKLTGNTTTASKVTCWVNGSERVDA